MKWFRHFTKALTDPKIEKLIMRHGIEGYGLYFACLEIIAGNLTGDNITFELEHDAEILAYKFKIDTMKVESIMKFCVELGLFEYNKISKRIQCIKLLEYIDDSSAKNPEIKKIVNAYEKKIKVLPIIEETEQKGEIQKFSENFGKIPETSEQIRLDYIRLNNNTDDSIESEPDGIPSKTKDQQDGSSLDTLNPEEKEVPPVEPVPVRKKDNWYKKSDNAKAVAYIKKVVGKYSDGYVFTPMEHGVMKNIVNNLRKIDEENQEVFNWELFADKWDAYIDPKFWLDKGAKNLMSFYKNFNRIEI